MWVAGEIAYVEYITSSNIFSLIVLVGVGMWGYASNRRKPARFSHQSTKEKGEGFPSEIRQRYHNISRKCHIFFWRMHDMYPKLETFSSTCRASKLLAYCRRDVMEGLETEFKNSFERQLLEWVSVETSAFSKYPNERIKIYEIFYC